MPLPPGHPWDPWTRDRQPGGGGGGAAGGGILGGLLLAGVAVLIVVNGPSDDDPDPATYTPADAYTWSAADLTGALHAADPDSADASCVPYQHPAAKPGAVYGWCTFGEGRRDQILRITAGDDGAWSVAWVG